MDTMLAVCSFIKHKSKILGLPDQVANCMLNMQPAYFSYTSLAKAFFIGDKPIFASFLACVFLDKKPAQATVYMQNPVAIFYKRALDLVEKELRKDNVLFNRLLEW